MRRILYLLAEFILLTIPLTWAWLRWGSDAYTSLILAVIDPLYEMLGATHVKRGPTGHRFISYVPFLVLMAITPRIPTRRRIWGTLFGILVIFCSHVGMLYVADRAYTEHENDGAAVAQLFPFLLVTDGLPLMLWFVLARDFLRSAVPGLREKPPSE
ncbi:MAG: hypothetical protein QF890_04960 [Myxococcota bacterium]|jgi:hypothetical protein|nr:hypothetical protein [bacterium]MDP6073792.1 hypothetical protein [Myxococcota bacterium]MDP7073315.1 hypothetical protein [Myxococcota bacterium]MDP7297875.1 hypothetical protein [Myxococcota bacterium]MDP7431909.1 hypothetical protein [Myxococcota bacterium]